MSTVLVTGGFGLLGNRVVEGLHARGDTVRVLTHRSAATHPHAEVAVGDLATGDGLRDAVDGVDAVVHCASDARRAFQVDALGTAKLLDAARDAGSAHFVYVSIVGVDRIPWGYYRAKRQAEKLVELSGLPYSIQRATQFHDFVGTMLRGLARPPVVILPWGFRFQPVDVREVAGSLVDLASGENIGRAPDFGGPEILPASELARTWLQVTGQRRLVLSAPVPGRIGQAFRDGANVCPESAQGRRTWAEFLRAAEGAGKAAHVVGGEAVAGSTEGHVTL